MSQAFTYTPPDGWDTARLKREAMNAAKEHSQANGGGRPVMVDWILHVVPGGIALVVSYSCNRPNGHCGRYVATVAL